MNIRTRRHARLDFIQNTLGDCWRMLSKSDLIRFTFLKDHTSYYKECSVWAAKEGQENQSGNRSMGGSIGDGKKSLGLNLSWRWDL